MNLDARCERCTAQLRHMKCSMCGHQNFDGGRPNIPPPWTVSVGSELEKLALIAAYASTIRVVPDLARIDIKQHTNGRSLRVRRRAPFDRPMLTADFTTPQTIATRYHDFEYNVERVVIGDEHFLVWKLNYDAAMRQERDHYMRQEPFAP